MPSAPKPRARLSEAQVIEIFRVRSSALTATYIASLYTVSEKAVRDIWKGRTWSTETWHLDKSRPLKLTTVGRPKGCKDKQPRKKRASNHDDLSAVTWPAYPMQCMVVEDAGMQDIRQMPREASPRVELGQIADPKECVEDMATWHRSSAACRTLTTLGHASVNEQLHEWDSFWRFSPGTDPFCGDWNPCCQ